MNKAEQHPFSQLSPELILKAADSFGTRSTGRYFQLNAMENRVFQVELEDESMIILKFYRPGRWSPEAIEEEHRFLFLAAQNEIPVVPPILSANTKNSFVADNGFLYAAFPRRAGRLEPELNQTQLERLGRYLARLHNLGETYAAPNRPRIDVFRMITEPLEHLSQSIIKPNDLWDRFLNLAKKFEAICDDKLKNAKMIALHGDCHVGNVLWRDDEPIIIDFDDMAHGPSVQDFWMMNGGDDEYAKKRLDYLLYSYCQLRDFDDHELSLVPVLRAMRMIYFLAWIDRRWSDPSFPRSFPDYPTQRYWMEQIESLYILGESL